ncbi:centrosomal protein of 128 kDa-like [Trifolium pratense]|uniref:centrosomal protein of 128 kDa-like n=1 Tax=Trifolium pratense TaxID=57577 RepID=UPI001E6936AB|nr:centrosomal protein of 128 kDa-like [Trifolium pratense]
MKDFDDSVLQQILEELDTCLLIAQCRILEGQITRDELEQELLQVRFLRDDVYEEEYKDETFDYNVPPQEEEECYMKKINWEQMLPPQVLPKDSYDKNSHIKDVLIEFMNINQGSIDKFESQCERLSEQIVEFKKMNEKLEIGDDLIDVKKKDEEEELIKVEDDLVETQKSQLLSSEYVDQEISQHKNIPQIVFSNKVEKREEIDEVLDAIYALFINFHLKKLWKKHHLYLKFMEFLPNKMKKKDDVFFVSYMPP